jgi:hypothetical protein
MADKPSVAEEAGMLFEARCEEALIALRQKWGLLQNLSAETLRFTQEHAQNISVILGKSSATGADMLKSRTTDLFQKLGEIDEKFYAGLWERAIQSAHDIYGSDATDFALKAMETELKGN